MSKNGFKLPPRDSWQMRMVRVTVTIVIVIGVVYLQNLLVTLFPLPVDVQKSTPPVTPLTAGLIRKEELIVDHPSKKTTENSATDIPPEVLFQDDRKDDVTIDAHFASARLGDEVWERLRRDPQKRPLPPEGLQRIAYTTTPEEDASPNANKQMDQPGAEPCRTSVLVSLADKDKMPTEIHFQQLDDPGSDQHHYVEVKAIGADLVVQLSTRNSAPNLGALEGPGCRKTFTVGDDNWSRSFSSPLPQSVIVPAGTSFRLTFTTFAGKTAWAPDGSYEPFGLEAVPLYAEGLRRALRPASTKPWFSVTAVKRESPLVLEHLLVKADELLLAYSGKAIVEENDKYLFTFNLVEFFKSQLVLGLLLAGLETAFVQWIIRFAARARPAKPKPAKPKPKSKRNRKKK